MDPYTPFGVAGLALGGFLVFALAYRWASRVRAPKAAASAPDVTLGLGRAERRIEDLEGMVRALADRFEAVAGSGAEERLQALSGPLVALIRDKNATLETALGGIDQLRARLRALEQMGEVAEARGLFERLETQLAGIQAAQAAAEAATEARLKALQAALGEDSPHREVADQLTRLYAQKDAAIEAVLARLAPLEARLGELAPLEARLGELGPLEVRVGALEAGLESRNPQAALDRFAERLEAAEAQGAERLAAERARLTERIEGLAATQEEQAAGLRERVALLEGQENPFATIAEQLTRLYAQKDATVETVFARLAPLEARLGELEAGIASRDPQAMLDRFAERLEAVQGRVALLEGQENPFAAISEQLTRLYAQKDATVETVFARLAPLEVRLGELEAGIALRDPQAALDRFAERLEAAEAQGAERLAAERARFAERIEGLVAAQEAQAAGLRKRVALLEGQENPFAAISEQLTRLYAQKDATVETVFARLAPLEARLGELAPLEMRMGALEAGLESLNPQAALDRFAERLAAAEAGFEARLAAERAAQAERLEAGEARLAEGIQAVQGSLGERLDAAETAQAARLAAVEAAEAAQAARVAEEIAALEAGLASLDPRAALEDLAARIAALQGAQGAAAERIAELRAAAADNPAGRFFTEISNQLARFHDQKDAAVEALAARLAPLENQLAALEAHPWDAAEEAARSEAQAIATQMIAARAAAEQTALFADRLAVLEASLPRLTAEQSRMMQALDRARAEDDLDRARAGNDLVRIRVEDDLDHARVERDPARDRTEGETSGDWEPVEGAAPGEDAGNPEARNLDEIWSLSRIVSMHHR